MYIEKDGRLEIARNRREKYNIEIKRAENGMEAGEKSRYGRVKRTRKGVEWS